MAESIRSFTNSSMSAVSPDENKYRGSPGGILFVQKVRRAFAISKGGTLPSAIQYRGAQDRPPVDEGIAGSESLPNIEKQGADKTVSLNVQVTNLASYGVLGKILGVPPGIHHAKELLAVYFQLWHPLFPFLHSPAFMQEIDSFYAKNYSLETKDTAEIRKNTCRAVLFQCIFNIAALGSPDINLSPDCYIESNENLLSLLGSTLLSKHDVLSLQALLAAQVYLTVTMSLRAASMVGGMLLRAMVQSGFHRCPFRLPQLSQHDLEIRKRIFWTAYAIDRYLSQTLGHPLGIQDSDIDVCFPDIKEIHIHVANTTQVSDDISVQLQKISSRSNQAASASASADAPARTVPETRLEPLRRELDYVVDGKLPRQNTEEEIFANYVIYSRVIGQALELLHRPNHTSSVKWNDVLMLASNVQSWRENLPKRLQDAHSAAKFEGGGGNIFHFASSFSVIYQQLILFVNRPFLCQEPHSLQFRSSLHSCIGAGRAIISTLSGQMSVKTSLFWPGTLSGIWMSGLILIFGCEHGLYPFNETLLSLRFNYIAEHFSTPFRETTRCLDLLQTMDKKWTSAKHCHEVLSILVADLCGLQRGNNNTSAKEFNEHDRPKSSQSRRRSQRGLTDGTSSKRQKLGSSNDASRENAGISQHIPQSLEHGADPNDPTTTKNVPPETEQGNEFQWLQNAALQGVVPNMQDMFGSLSWERLSQGDGSDIYLWPFNSDDEQAIFMPLPGQGMDQGAQSHVEEEQRKVEEKKIKEEEKQRKVDEEKRKAEEARMNALRAMARRDDPPPPGVVRRGPAPPYVQVRFAEEWE